MAGNVVEVVGDAGHVASYVLAAVVDARVLEAEEGNLDELASAQRHVLRVLGGDAELEEVELVDILQESSGVGEDLARRISADAEENPWYVSHPVKVVRFASLLLWIESLLRYWHVCLAFAQEELEEVVVIKVCLRKVAAGEQGSYANLVVNGDEPQSGE